MDCDYDECDYDECDCDECCPPKDRARGFQGEIGRAGMDIVGPQGFVGPDYTAPQGPQGFQGNVCCDAESLRGAQGDQGQQGQNQQGLQGPMGFQGTMTVGFEGVQGLPGFEGPQGFADRGPQGFQGLGMLGAQGVRGFQGWTGATSSFAGATGPQGGVLTGFTTIVTLTYPSSTNGAFIYSAPPGLGRYLCSIQFLCAITNTSGPANVTFTAKQNSITLGSTQVTIVPGDINNNLTFVGLDVQTLNNDNMNPIDVFYASNVARPWIFTNSSATFVQIQ